jgi:MFS family permease
MSLSHVCDSHFDYGVTIFFIYFIRVFLFISSLSLQLIENWIRSVISERNGGAIVEKSQVTLIWAVAVAIFCFGGMIGGLMTGIVAEKFGRKGGLLVSNSLVVVSSLLQGKHGIIIQSWYTLMGKIIGELYCYIRKVISHQLHTLSDLDNSKH